MILIYRVLIFIFFPLILITLYLRVLLNKEHPKRFKEKIFINFFNIKKPKNSKLILFHAASVGEFRSIIPIIEQLNVDKKFSFLITTTTLSSGNLAQKVIKKFDNVQHRFLPIDINYLIESFLNNWKPDKIFLVESEIWPNLILKANQRKIPIVLLNGRLTKKSFKRWMLFPNIAKKIFGSFQLCLCSNKETKNYLEKFNAKNIKYIGNIKLINKINYEELDSINNQILSKSRFWVAASIHKEEDLLCLKTHIKLKKSYNDLISIIAPRHIDRVGDIKKMAEQFNLSVQILNEDSKIKKGSEILIINSYGVLHNYFFHAKSVFIGKSLIKKLKNDSGQNPVDAAKLNCKIYHGPHTSNFQEIYKLLKTNNISKKIHNHNELIKNLLIDLKNPKKKNLLRNNFIQILERNILSKTMKLLKKFINDND